MKIKFEWEIIHSFYFKSLGYSHQTKRAKVLGGWILSSDYFYENTGCSQSSIFISDPQHRWEIDND
jgi:hypothetical protein